MIRFIIKRTVHREDSPYHMESFETLDIAVPQLEILLRRGGNGNGGYDESVLIGCEVLEDDR